MARRVSSAPLVVVRHALLGNKALVSSRSHPGDWHVVDAEGRCDCEAAKFGRLCSHVKALREHVELESTTSAPSC